MSNLETTYRDTPSEAVNRNGHRRDWDDQEISIDLRLIARIFRRRAPLWVALGLILWVGLFIGGLHLIKRSYTSVASLAMQQSSGVSMGGLAALTGIGASSGKSYKGVIGSRAFAAHGVDAAQIRELYGLPKPAHAGAQDKAIDMVQKAVSLDDRKDGLLYLSVTLPDRLSPLAPIPQDRVKEAAKTLADAYVERFRDFLSSSNSDRDTYLIRKGQQEVDNAWDEYRTAIGRLSEFVVDSPIAAQGATTQIVRGGDAFPNMPAPAAAAGELQSLYSSKAQLQAEIQAAKAARVSTSNLVSGQSSGATLPGEDPLLSDARKQVRSARSELQNLRIELSDENPEVVAARQRLQLAEARLKEEEQAVRQGRTSDRVRLDALEAKYTTVNRQISEAEKQFRIGRAASANLQKLQNDAAIRLEVWKATATQYATIKVQTVAADSLITIMDEARLPDRGQPGVIRIAILSLFLVLVLLFFWAAVDYLIQSQKKEPAEIPSLPSGHTTEARTADRQ